jgi:3-oxoacyl-[acyl-carrier protein] reductase
MLDIGPYFDLSGQVAAVTGGASGIGKASAEVLAAAGASVAIGDIDIEGATETAETINAAGGRAFAVRTDTTSQTDVDALVDRAVAEYGRLDVMGNIAGVGYAKPLMDTTEADFDRIMAINLKGVLFGCQAAVRVMGPQGGGSIINITSTAIDTPYPNQGLYGAAKAGVVFFTQVLAAEAGAQGVRVNAVAPGATPTNFAAFRYEDGKITPEKEKEFKDRMASMTPLGFLGEAIDQALMVLFLASPASRWATGNVFRVNGGQSRAW